MRGMFLQIRLSDGVRCLITGEHHTQGELLTCFDPTPELCALTRVFTDDHAAEVCTDWS